MKILNHARENTQLERRIMTDGGIYVAVEPKQKLIYAKIIFFNCIYTSNSKQYDTIPKLKNKQTKKYSS